MNPRLLLGGLKSYLPLPFDYTGTGGSVTGAYCYSVWLRHLTMLAKHAGESRPPRVLVEIGPGDSIGLGLAGLLSGVSTYYGLDVLEHASAATNLRVLDELVALYRDRTPIPDEDAFPLLHPRLPAYDFPAELIDPVVLQQRLSPQSVDLLRNAIIQKGQAESSIQFRCPWGPESVAPASADLVLSQVALQDMDHTSANDTLGDNLQRMARWLKPGGLMSHQIDFSCPGGSPWNHHWTYGDSTWRIVRGKRPYYVNRVPLSGYVRLIEKSGCSVVGIEHVRRAGVPRSDLAARFAQLPDEDLNTAAALIIARKTA